MAGNRTEEKNKTNVFSGIGRFFKNIGDTFNKNGEKSDTGPSVHLDISPGIEEMPPIINEHELDLDEPENDDHTPFGDSLKKILSILNATEAKQKFVDFIRKKEVDRLTPFEIETLDSAFHQAMVLGSEKRKKYDSFTGSRDIGNIEQLLKTLKGDNSTPLFVKQEIAKEILKELKENPPGNGQKISSLVNNYTIFLKRLDWEIKGEKRIIDYTVKTLNKANDAKDRFTQLNDLAPYIQARIKDKKLKDISGKLFEYMLDFYNQLNQRITNLGDDADLDDELGLDFDDDNLPDFGADTDTFLRNLAKKDDPSGMASEIDKLPEETKADIIQEIAFDPRFDRYFQELVGFLNKEDLGTLIGMIISRVKELERTQGKHVSTEYITDLINRLAHKLGAEHIIVLKTKNIQLHLDRAHGESAAKLEELKRKIQGKNPLEQIQILKDTAEEPGSSAIFGAIRNLERLTVETRFDEIFSSLPLETQKVVAEGLLSDLVALKKYYPYLISRLEAKLVEVDRCLENNTYAPGDVDHELIDRIVDYANKSGGIPGREGETSRHNDEKNRVPAEIKELDREIDSLPSLNEKITTVRFWIENDYYSNKPQIELFLKNKLEALEQKKAREGGLLRDLFDELRGLETIKEKINFLEVKLKDPLYFHLKSMIKTLIGNIAENTEFAPETITEEWILNQLRGIPDINRKIDWLRIRRYLAPYEEFADFINDTIERFEGRQKEELQEELEDKIFGDMTLEKKAGKEKTIHKNIITLTRAALSLGNKVQRRKLIKEQEVLYPLDEQDRFFKQRKLLYYLLNTQNDDIPGLKLKVLADKVLLSFNEKKDYFSLLKLSRFKGGDKVLTLMDEIGLTGDDLAYYAVYILGCDRPGLGKRIQYIEDFRSGLVDADGVSVTTKDNRIIQKDYREFFNITPPVIVKVLNDLKKKVPEKRKIPDSGMHTDSVDNTDSDTYMDSEPYTDSETHMDSKAHTDSETYKNKDPDEKEAHNRYMEDSGEETSGNEILSEHKKEEILNNEDTIKDEMTETTGSITHQEKTEEETENKEPAEGENENPLNNIIPDTEKKNLEMHDKNRTIKFREMTTSEDDTSLSNASQDEMTQKSSGVKYGENEEEKDNEDKQAYSSTTVYEKNKTAIDNRVQKRIIEQGASKSKTSAHEMRINSEKATREKEIPLSKRIARLLFDLSKCFPEAVPDIINRTIIPVFIENKSETGRDIFNALNQNIFIPVLYSGAEIEVDSTVDSIESFLGKKGILTESHKIIKSIVNELQSTRSTEIKAEVAREMGKVSRTSEPIKKEPGDIIQVLHYLLGIDDPKHIIPALDEKYILPLSGNTQQKDLQNKLHSLKSIINTSKSINWEKVGEYFGNEAVGLLKQIKQRIGVYRTEDHVAGTTKQRNTGNTGQIKNQTDNKEPSSGNQIIIPKMIQNALTNAPVFVDPNAVILKISSRNPEIKKTFGGNRDVARTYVINTLYNAGKIFTYDKKRYIGFGKIADYLYDKKNKDYNKQALARALVAFIAKFPRNALKAAFIGVEEENLTGFLQMLEAWIEPARTAGDKKIASGKTLQKNHANKSLPEKQTHHDKTKQTVTQKHHTSTNKTSQHKTTSRIKDRRTHNRRKNKTHYTPEKERRKKDRRISNKSKTKQKYNTQKKGFSRKLSARGETMLKKAEKLITEKLLMLIKLYNNRESLKMLYNSYLSSSSDRKYRLNLIDEKKHSAIYNAIKDDDAVLERLRFDVNKVMKQYHKKIKKVKK